MWKLKCVHLENCVQLANDECSTTNLTNKNAKPVTFISVYFQMLKENFKMNKGQIARDLIKRIVYNFFHHANHPYKHTKGFVQL